MGEPRALSGETHSYAPSTKPEFTDLIFTPYGQDEYTLGVKGGVSVVNGVFGANIPTLHWMSGRCLSRRAPNRRDPAPSANGALPQVVAVGCVIC